jgi:hypothetical protein
MISSPNSARFRVALLSALFLAASTYSLSPLRLMAQTATAVSLQGSVKSSDGSPLPQANIELLHLPTGSLRRVSPDPNGAFFMPGLTIGGPYTLKVTHIGFVTHVRTGLYLRSRENTVMNIVLKQIDLKGEEVVITGERSDTTSREAEGALLFVGRSQIEILPMQARGLESAYRLSPYMTGENALGLNSAYNSVSLDGIGIADQYGLQQRESIPSSMQGSPVSLESIEEVRVDLSPFDVQRSGFTGAGISAVSRSGSNTPEGSVFAEGAGGWAVGKNPDDQRKDIRSFVDGRAGFWAGGPIVDSEAFYFISGEVSDVRLPIERRFDATQTLGTTYSFPSAVIAQLRSKLLKTYGYDPGRMDAVTLNRCSTNLFARFDVNLPGNNRLSLRYNYYDTESDRPPYGASVYAEGTLAKNSTRVQSIIAGLNTLITPKVSNELLVGFTSRSFTSKPQWTPMPFVDLIVLDQHKWWNHLTIGSEVGGNGERLLQDHLEVHNNVTIEQDEHLMTFGVQGDMFHFTNGLLSYGWGRYLYASAGSFPLGRPTEYEYRSFTGDNQTSWRAFQLGFLWQDEWRASPITTVSIGARIDIPIFPDKPVENPVLREAFLPLGYNVSTSFVPETRGMFSPRVGLSIYPRGDKSFHVRGGVGLFTGHVPYSWIGNLYDHTGIGNRHIKVSTGAPAFVSDPLLQPMPGTDTSLTETSEVVVVDRGFKLPQEVRWTIGVDIALPKDFSLSVEGVYSRTVNGVIFRNINLKPVGALSYELGNDERTLYGASSINAQWTYSRNDKRFTDVIFMSNGDQGTSTFLTVQVQRRPTHDGVFANAAYSYGNTMDVNSGGWDNAYDQWRYNPAERPNEPRLDYSAFDRTHRLVIACSYSHSWSTDCATTIGMVYTGTSGMPYSYVYDGDHNGDGESMNDLFFVPSSYSEILLINDEGELTVPSDPAYNQLFSFITQDDYLRTHRGKVCERNGARCPWAHQLDLRLAHSVGINVSNRIEVSAELLNVLNLLNGSWGLVQYVPNQVVPVLQFYKLDQKNRPWYRWAPRTSPLVADPLLSRWRLKLGVRYTF